MKEDTEVKNLLDSFPGIKIHSITNIKETIAEENEITQTRSDDATKSIFKKHQHQL